MEWSPGTARLAARRRKRARPCFTRWQRVLQTTFDTASLIARMIPAERSCASESAVSLASVTVVGQTCGILESLPP